MSMRNRREFLLLGAASVVGVSLRAALTGLPASFLLHGRAEATEGNPRIAILASSSSGEPVNVCGPGTYDPDYSDFFSHPRPGAVDPDEITKQTVNTSNLGIEAVSESAELLLGSQRVEMASGFAALLPEQLNHLVWFNYRSDANIHPQFKDVLTCFGQIRGGDGRGTSQLPAALAQEMAALLGTTTSDPLVIGDGTFVSNGSSLANYSPLKLKTLAQSVGQAMGGADNFAVMYDSFIDEAYRDIRENGTAQQLRFFDQHASSRREAAEFGSSLGQLLEEIQDNSIKSQMRCAAIIAKLRLSPVVLLNTHFGGDNHQDVGLLSETNHTLEMLAALAEYWDAIGHFGVADDVVFASLDVFGRNPKSDGNGRGHYGDFVSGLMMGTHLNGGVVGGWEVNGKPKATGINASTGLSKDADIEAGDTLQAYFKTIMNAVGVPSDRQDVRLPTGTVVSSVTG